MKNCNLLLELLGFHSELLTKLIRIVVLLGANTVNSGYNDHSYGKKIYKNLLYRDLRKKKLVFVIKSSLYSFYNDFQFSV